MRSSFTRRRGFVLAGVVVAIVGALAVYATQREGSTAVATGTTASATAEGEAGHTDEHDESEGPKRVTLTAAGFATAEIQVEPVRVGSPDLASPGLEAPGVVEADPRRIAIISPRVAARIERLTVVAGDRVAAGKVVALLNSKEFLVAQSDLQHAVRRAAILAGGADAGGASAIVQAARRRLALLGISAGDIARVERGGEPALYLPLVAPFSGSIMKTHVLTGEALESGSPVFTLADLTTVDVVAEIPERSIPMIRVGQGATVTLAAFPSVPYLGRVERILDELNPETRTFRAVIHVSNSNRELRPGMFASVRLAVPATAFPEQRRAGDTAAMANEVLLTIPESAIVTDGDSQFVFVRVAPMIFEQRKVDIAQLAPPGSAVVNSSFVLVRGGVKAGEQVVTRGAFTLKSELAKAGLGEHGH
ncbi:MAG: efflux RND transporter periplasmic adaptor subunit [Gemmatimonadaceae bacterium]